MKRRNICMACSGVIQRMIEKFHEQEAFESVPISNVIAKYLEIHLKPHRLASYERSVLATKRMISYLGPKTPAGKIRPLLDSYKAWRRQKVKLSTINRELTTIKAATRKALEWQMIAKDPLQGYKLDKVDDARTRYIEDAEFEKLVSCAHAELAPILILARHQGMRQGEILNLKWADVDLRRGLLAIRHSKSGEGRFLPMTSPIQDMLSKIPSLKRHGRVFTYRGLPIIRLGWLRHEFVKAVRAAGIIDFRFHDLRHTFASHVAMKGGDIQALAALLGHKTLRLTQRYTHLSPGYLKATIELAVPQLRMGFEGKHAFVKDKVFTT